MHVQLLVVERDTHHARPTAGGYYLHVHTAGDGSTMAAVIFATKAGNVVSEVHILDSFERL